MSAPPERALAGLQQLLAIRDGTAPPAPIQELLAFDLVEVTGGRAAFRYWLDARHRNPLGTVHGGVAMTLLDSAAGAAVHSTLSDGSGYTTLETNVNLVRAVERRLNPARETVFVPFVAGITFAVVAGFARS